MVRIERGSLSVQSLFGAKGMGMSAASDALLDALLEEHGELVRRVRGVMRVRLPAYRTLPLDKLDDEVGVELARLLQCARAGGVAPGEDQLEDLAGVGEMRAYQGIPLADMLRAWHIGTEVVVHHAREVGEHLGLRDAEVLKFVESIFSWSDVGIAAVNDAYQRAALSAVGTDGSRRAEFVWRILFGTISAAEFRIFAETCGIDSAGEYVAVRARTGDPGSTHRLKLALGSSDPSHAFCDLADGEIAGFLSGPPRRDVDGVVGFGPPRPLDRLAESYQLAARALMTAQAYGLSGAHDISSLGLRMTVAMDIDIGDFLRKRYLEPLEASGSAGELIATLRAYLVCGMHVGRTATQLRVHQNTVRYRLARFEALVRASLRDTETLLETWWAIELSAMRL